MNSSMRWFPVAGVVLLILTACTTKDFSGAMPVVRPVAPDTAHVFDYQPKDVGVTANVTETRADYDILRVTYAHETVISDKDPKVVAWYYRQHGPSTGTVIQLPILNESPDYVPSTLFAEDFAEHGLNVLRFEREVPVVSGEGGLERTHAVIVGNIIDIRRGIDWLLTQSGERASKLGVCGISMGGFQASLLMAADDRLAAGVFILNGCDFPRLLVESDEIEVVEFRDALLKSTGWSIEEYHRHAERELADIDPATHAPRLDPQKILAIHSRFDAVVPFELSSRWWDLAGRPQRRVMPLGHYTAIFAIHYVQRAARNFFVGRFAGS